MDSVAIITARGGSKRIPRKNIRDFRGKPIIAYSIETALKSQLFDLVMVSTDDEEIAGIAKQYGATVPFYRSAATANDFSITADVVVEVILQLKAMDKNFKYACCIYPTAPLISIENLAKGYELLKRNNYTTVFPVCPFSFPIYRGLQLKEEGKVEMIWPENMETRSQDLPGAYHDAGQFYWVDVASFMQERQLYTSNSGSIILDAMQIQDIDDETDWEIAALKHTLLYP
ncbi:MAG: pseudaminic acid cytidylyltransferase [Chitinophagaceae bacterium]